MQSPLTDQNVLVTGGAGAFGQAFVRRALEDGARKVVVYSRGEARQAEMRAALPDPRLRFIIGDVRSAERIYDACRGIDLVAHAAAIKRIEVAEANPWEAIQTNVVGTQNVARACIERGVKRAVLTSTDKAAAPCTLYGATKLAAERLWNASNVHSAGTPTRFATTRYGNVAQSTGSVIPTWRREMAATGIISITDPDMTRFLMSMQDAVDLVVTAFATMRGGETIIPKLASASVRDMAHAAFPDAPWFMAGARPNEKQHETLISADEAPYTHDAGYCFIIEPESRSWGDLPPLGFPKVRPDFQYDSHTAPRLGSKLRELVAA